MLYKYGNEIHSWVKSQHFEDWMELPSFIIEAREIIESIKKIKRNK